MVVEIAAFLAVIVPTDTIDYEVQTKPLTLLSLGARSACNSVLVTVLHGYG